MMMNSSNKDRSFTCKDNPYGFMYMSEYERMREASENDTQSRIRKFAKRCCDSVARHHLKLLGEKKSLLTFLVHGLFQNRKEIDFNLVDPLEKITVEHFRRFVEYFLSENYHFVTPVDIINGLEADRKYILASFDDGYFNNHHALPILKEFKVPATFFVSTDHVINNRSFWWDILWRERTKRMTLPAKINEEANGLKSRTNSDIERYLLDLFGENAFQPQSDIDRPMSVAELKEFSKEEYVQLGNHTSEHAILTNYPPDGLRRVIEQCQIALQMITGAKPEMISYPNGNFSHEVIRVAMELGLRSGLTLIPLKNRLPLKPGTMDAMMLGRFIMKGDGDLDNQFELYRSDFSLAGLLGRRLRRRYGS